MHTYLGIDPSLTSTGIVLLSSNTRPTEIALCPTTRKYRLSWFYSEVEKLLWGRRVTYAAIEGPSYGSVGRGSDLDQLRGALRLLLELRNIPYVIPAPKEVKKFGAGLGGATKPQMVRAANADGCASDLDDICDAWHLARLAEGVYLGRSPKPTRASAQVVHNLITRVAEHASL